MHSDPLYLNFNCLFFFHRRKNQQKERKDPCGDHMAVCAALGYFSFNWLGKIWPGALWPVLYSGLERHEGTEPIFCHHHLLHEPHSPSHHHHLMLLCYCSETIHYLQVYGRQQPHPQHGKDAAAAHGGESVWFTVLAPATLLSWNKICTLCA